MRVNDSLTMKKRGRVAALRAGPTWIGDRTWREIFERFAFIAETLATSKSGAFAALVTAWEKPAALVSRWRGTKKTTTKGTR